MSKVFVRLTNPDNSFQDITQPDGVGLLRGGEIREVFRTDRLQKFIRSGAIEVLQPESKEVLEYKKSLLDANVEEKKAEEANKKVLNAAIKEGEKAKKELAKANETIADQSDKIASLETKVAELEAEVQKANDELAKANEAIAKLNVEAKKPEGK